jgi:hypothetical protein
MIAGSDSDLITIGFEAGQKRRRKIITRTLAPLLPSALAPLVVGYLDVDVDIMRMLYDPNSMYPAYRANDLMLAIEGLSGSANWRTLEYMPVRLALIRYECNALKTAHDSHSYPTSDMFRLLIGDEPYGDTLAGFVCKYIDDTDLAHRLCDGLWTSIMALASAYKDEK